jgi:hypothetical protein
LHVVPKQVLHACSACCGSVGEIGDVQHHFVAPLGHENGAGGPTMLVFVEPTV